MALTLSVGFIVDDAIVMLENIMRHVEEGEAPREAAFKGSAEIAFTILSMTVSLAAVFIPVVFMGGIVGRLLHEFAVTIVIAIVVSGLVSVTLTPMLCSRFIRAGKGQQHGRFYQWTENAFDRVQAGYERSLKWSLTARPRHHGRVRRSAWSPPSCMFMVIQEDFIPCEDTGQINVNTEAADRTSFAQMTRLSAAPGRHRRAAIPMSQAVLSSVGSRRRAQRHQHRLDAAEAQADPAQRDLSRRPGDPGTAAQAAARHRRQCLYAESARHPRRRPAIQILLSIYPAGHRPGRIAEKRHQADGRA